MFNIIPDTEAFNERYTVIYPLGEFIVRLPDGQEVSLIPTKFVDQVAAYEAEHPGTVWSVIATEVDTNDYSDEESTDEDDSDDSSDEEEIIEEEDEEDNTETDEPTEGYVIRNGIEELSALGFIITEEPCPEDEVNDGYLFNPEV